MTEPIETLANVARLLRETGTPFALVGGLAVSVRAEIRFTRDVDLAISVSADSEVEALVVRLRGGGYVPRAVVEQEAVGRIATVRLVGGDGVTVDLLAASSGIEPEVVASASDVDIPPIGAIPVARAEELFALKILAAAPRRRQDEIDLESLLRVNPSLELDRVRELLRLITGRGYHRGEDLPAKLAAILAALS